MNRVKVRKAELLQRLEANRGTHRTLFLEAQDGYRELVIGELDKALKDAREGRAIRTVIQLQAPQDHTAEYDNVIEMLRMSVDDEIELEAHAFQCFVLDQWQWTHATRVLNSAYAEHAKSKQL